MTKVNWVRPLILALILLILGSLAYWLEYSHKPKKEESEASAKKIFKLKEVPVASIRIVDGPKRFTFKCLDLATKLCKAGDQSKWELTEPSRLRGDESNINSFLSTLSHLDATDTLDLSTDTPEKRLALLKEYRLDEATRKTPDFRRVEITPEKGEPITIFLGETNPIGDTIFALSGNDEAHVLLVPNYFKNNFDHALTHWRDKKLFTLSAHQVQSFELQSPKAGRIRGEKKDAQWTLRTTSQGKSEEIPGDLDAIENLLSGATTLSAKNFTAENKNDKAAQKVVGGLKPLITFTAQAQPSPATSPTPAITPPPMTLKLYEKKKKDKTEALYATVSNLDPLFELDTTAKDKFDKALKDLRLSKLLTSMERYSVKRLEFSGSLMGSTPLILNQTDAKWKTLPDGQEVKSDKIQSLLDKLSGNRIQEFIQSSALPTGEQQGVIVALGDEKEPQKKKLVFWKSTDPKSSTKLYARDLLSKRKEAFQVDSAIGDALPWNRNFFSPTQVVVPAPSPKK